jgi:hypothetical protein
VANLDGVGSGSPAVPVETPSRLLYRGLLRARARQSQGGAVAARARRAHRAQAAGIRRGFARRAAHSPDSSLFLTPAFR